MTWIKMIRDRRGSLVALKAPSSLRPASRRVREAMAGRGALTSDWTERAAAALLAPSPERLQGDVEHVQILRAAPRRTHRFDDQALPLGLGDRAQEDVIPVVLLSGEVHLRDHHVEEPAVHLEMDVRRSDPASRDRIRARLDGLERVLAVGVRGGFAEPQKVRVLRGGIGIGDVDIPTSRIGLPDLHHGALDRPALFVDDASGDLNDLAVRLSGRARDDGQVVVVDHRPGTVEAVQIKWSLVLPGRLPALLSGVPGWGPRAQPRRPTRPAERRAWRSVDAAPCRFLLSRLRSSKPTCFSLARGGHQYRRIAGESKPAAPRSLSPGSFGTILAETSRPIPQGGDRGEPTHTTDRGRCARPDVGRFHGRARRRGAGGSDELGSSLQPGADPLRTRRDTGPHHAVYDALRAPRRAGEAAAG